MSLFSIADQEKIAAAIAQAETKTSGEIVAVVSASSSSYLYAPFLWASLIALLVPWPFIVYTWWPVVWIYLLQLAVFFVLLAVFLIRPLRYRLVPRSIKKRTAHRRAVEQFLAQNLHTTQGRTGVLIFVSLAERHAEIVADTEIDETVRKGTWQEIVDELTRHLSRDQATDGFITAIKQIGSHLSAAFPPGSGDPNELPDHLIIIEQVDDLTSNTV
jgi:putative membrane protein